MTGYILVLLLIAVIAMLLDSGSVRQYGTAHYYNKFDGYEMKMVRLTAGNRETVMVFDAGQEVRNHNESVPFVRLITQVY